MYRRGGMLQLGEASIVVLYFFLLVCLSVYGVHRTYLMYLYIKGSLQRSDPAAFFLPGNGHSPRIDTPSVTVQLPVYNEMHVVVRLIDAVGRLCYPRSRFEVQVLDDSTDCTSRIALLAVQRWRNLGVDISYFHRSTRTGFKAGALAYGLSRAKGELVAIFDADFMPSPDFLSRSVALFVDDKVGMVQARWGHINRDSSLLTRIQALFLDAHFILEHGARNMSGRFFNFNGTAGVWRRSAIVSSGGWHDDTLAEDLDLSYRAQLMGWQFIFMPDVVAPAELPTDMNAFKSQQRRWTQGSVQACFKIVPRVFLADLPLKVKVEAFFHLTGSFNFLLVFVWSLLLFPVTAVRGGMSGWLLWFDAPLFLMVAFSVVHCYALSQRAIGGRWIARLRSIPALMAVGLGLSMNNSFAILEVLARRKIEFSRTPKYGAMAATNTKVSSPYRRKRFTQPVIELVIGFYFACGAAYAIFLHVFSVFPVMLLFSWGFFYLGWISLIQQQTLIYGMLPAQMESDAARHVDDD